MNYWIVGQIYLQISKIIPKSFPKKLYQFNLPPIWKFISIAQPFSNYSAANIQYCQTISSWLIWCVYCIVLFLFCEVFSIFSSFCILNILVGVLPGSLPQQDPGVPSGWTASAGERETQWDKARGLSLKFILHGPFIPLTTSFLGEVHIAYTKVSSKHYSNLIFNRNRMLPIYFLFTRVFFIIWPSGLLTFYDLHLVWLKQLQ